MESETTTPQDEGNSAAAASSNSNGNDKKTKGRLKKLLKKSYAVDHARDVSGLVEPGDWVELRELLLNNQQGPQRPIPGVAPKLQWRKGKGEKDEQQDEGLVVDAADHRDLLFRLLSSGSTLKTLASPGRKRKLTTDDPKATNEDGEAKEENARGDGDGAPVSFHNYSQYKPRVPPWASIHNPARIERAAVLEFHCSSQSQYEAIAGGLLVLTDDDSYSGSDEKQMKDANGSSQCSQRPVLAVPTRWFANPHHPKSMSHGLLYATPTVRKSHDPCHSKVITIRDLYRALVALGPTTTEMTEEGYPVSAFSSHRSSAERTTKAQNDDEEELCSSASPSPATIGNNLIPSDRIDDPENHLLPLPDAAVAQQMVQRRASVEGAQHQEHGSNEAVAPIRYYVQSADTAARNDDDGRVGGSGGVPPLPRVLAVDCEMVETTLGRELARVTLLELAEFDGGSEQMRTVIRMDHLVRPHGMVTDYLTPFSGITAHLLESGPTATLAQVQAALCRFVSSRDVLVGHSLENDLHALRLVHPTVVDTALLFRARGAKYKHSLRHLAANLLQKQIQHLGSHCSREDASAALELAVRRALRGPNFARHLVRPQPVNLLTLLSQHGTTPLVCLGSSDWLREHVESRSTIHALTCDELTHPNRKAVISWLTAANPSRRAKLAYGSWRLCGDGEESTGGGKGDAAEADAAVAFVRELRSRVDVGTVLCVALQVGFHKTARLAEQRKARMNPKATATWTDQEEDDWTQTCITSRVGKVFWILGRY